MSTINGNEFLNNLRWCKKFYHKTFYIWSGNFNFMWVFEKLEHGHIYDYMWDLIAIVNERRYLWHCDTIAFVYVSVTAKSRLLYVQPGHRLISLIKVNCPTHWKFIYIYIYQCQLNAQYNIVWIFLSLHIIYLSAIFPTIVDTIWWW